MERTPDRCVLHFELTPAPTTGDTRPRPPSLILFSLDLMRSVLLAFLFAASCLASDDHSAWYAAYGDVGDKHFQSKATWSQIEQAPRWSPDTEEMPPLAPTRAQSIALRTLEPLIPPGQEWHLHEVRIVDGGLRTHWLYEVSFRREYPRDPNVAVFGGEFMAILVLMDGTAIEPRAIPRPGPEHPK
jgi:hypothetical protein